MSTLTAPTPAEAPGLTPRARERPLAGRAGRAALVALLALTVVAYAVALIQAVGWMRTPFIGVLLEPPLTASPSLTGGTLFGARPLLDAPPDLAAGDTITAVDGDEVSGAASFYRLLRGYAPGDSIRLQVSPESGPPRESNVTLAPVPPEIAPGLFGIAVAAGLVYLGIGLWTYRSSHSSATGQWFLALCLAVALALGTTFDLWTTHTLVRLWAAAVPLVAGLLASFAMIFPGELALVARRPALRWLPLIAALALLIAIQTQIGRAYAIVARAWAAMAVFTAVCIAAFLLVMLWRSLRLRSPALREQSRVVLASALLAFLPLTLRASGVVALPAGWVLLALLVFPLAVAYSVAQSDAIDSSRLLGFAAIYGLMAGVITAGYALLVAGVNYLAAALLLGRVSAASPVLVGLLAFSLVLAFQPLRRRLQALFDALFYRAPAANEERLTYFRHEIALASGLGEVVRLLTQQIDEGLKPAHIYVFLRDPRTGDFAAASNGERPATDVRFETHSGLVHLLSTTRVAFLIDPARPLPPELHDAHARLAVLGTPLLVPLQGQDRLAGWVAIGPRRSGEPFSAQDLRFVQAVTEQASLAVERAQVVNDLERRVRELDVLAQVAQAVNFTTDPGALLELIYTQCSRLIDTTNFYIILHDPEQRRLSYALFVEGEERSEQHEGQSWPDDVGLEAEVVRTARPIRTTSYAAEAVRRGVTPLDAHKQAWMGVPLNVGARTLGVMAVASYRQDANFTDDQFKVFWAIADQAATALDKTRLFNETEMRARHLAKLNEISKELSSTLDLDRLLPGITRAAMELIGTRYGTLYLVDPPAGDLVPYVSQDADAGFASAQLPAQPGVIAAGAAWTGEPVIENSSNPANEYGSSSVLAVPLRLQDRTTGVIELSGRLDGSPFSDEDAALLATFAAQAAIAIENARRYEATDAELAARVDELQTLQSIDRELNRTLKLDLVIRTTLEWAQRMTGASAGLIGMLNADQTGLDILASSGYSREFLDTYQAVPYPIERGILGHVMHSGQPEFVEDVTRDPDFRAGAPSQTVAQITVPILRAGGPIGALVLESDVPGQLTQAGFEFAQRLVEHAAVAIENARLLQEVEQANRSKTEFISFVTHELKNPMTSIRGYTDLLRMGQMGPLTDTQAQFLATIRANADRMARLVSDLADVARIEAGQLRLEKAPVAVQDIVDETVQALRGQIEEKNQSLHVELPADLPPLYADHTRMVQVLTNLVSNASKYTPEGGAIWIGAQLETTTDADGSERTVIHHWVRDTGIGMTPDEMEKLFTKFFRSQRGKEMAPGTGLGLIITRSLVEQHDGTIWAESEEGKGSVFHYMLPAAPAAS